MLDSFQTDIAKNIPLREPADAPPLLPVEGRTAAHLHAFRELLQSFSEVRSALEDLRYAITETENPTVSEAQGDLPTIPLEVFINQAVPNNAEAFRGAALALIQEIRDALGNP